MEQPIQTDFLRWIVFLPLLGAIDNGLVGAKIQKSLGKGAISLLACAPVIVAFGLSVQALLTLQGLDSEKRFLIDRLYIWIDLGSLKVEMAFLVDPLSAVMILVVTGVGGLIHIYATGYMHDDKAFWRSSLIIFHRRHAHAGPGRRFAAAVRRLEGVGLSPTRSSVSGTRTITPRAGNKAFIVNASATGFVLSMFLLLVARCAGTWNLDRARDGQVGAGHRSSNPPKFIRSSRSRRFFSSSAPPASRRRFRSTSGCPTPWPGRRPSAR
jgi:NADH-quinone oxidoreductase subunit L